MTPYKKGAKFKKSSNNQKFQTWQNQACFFNLELNIVIAREADLPISA